MKVLAIETSCDETAIAILTGQKGVFKMEKNSLYSQIPLHRKYGGVVPELASRKHAQTIPYLLQQTLSVKEFKKIDCVAVTAGPGLITSLVLGTTLAKTLAYLFKKPLLAVNHIEGHIYSNWLSSAELMKNSAQYFPALVLIVSGGHTELILMKGHGQYQLIGQTLDDAAGESFDKVAKLLNLGYPGGPIIAQLASQGEATAYDLPRPMLKNPDYNFSFSGLKTAVLYSLQKTKKIKPQEVKNYAASFQQAVVDVLLHKTMRAAKNYRVKSLMLGGGVAANQSLTEHLRRACNQEKLPFFAPERKYTGDNAAMIAVAAYYNLINKKGRLFPAKRVLDLQPFSNWQLAQNDL